MDHHEEAPPANRAVKLPLFWTTNPRFWFTSAEGAFRLRNITDEESRFYNCLHALPEATVSLIADLVEADPIPVNPYMELCCRLLAAHQLTPGTSSGLSRSSVSRLWPPRSHQNS